MNICETMSVLCARSCFKRLSSVTPWNFVISGFRREVADYCALQSLLRSEQWWFFTDVSGPETSLRNYRFSLRSSPDVDWLSSLYCPLYHRFKLRSMKWAEHVAHVGEKCLRGFGGETSREEATLKHRCKWEDDIKIQGYSKWLSRF